MTAQSPDMKDVNKLRAHAESIRKAIQDEGPHPRYHRKQLERLKQEWPTLHNAIMELINDSQKGDL